MPYRPKNSRFWHFDFQIAGRRFHGSCGTEDFETAKAIEAEARVAAKSTPDQSGVYTLSQTIGTYYADQSQHQPSARTSFSQGKSILEIIPPQTLLADLTQANIQRFVSIRRATVANGTINRQLQYLGRALRHMARTYGAAIPDIDLKAAETREAHERIRELTEGEQSELFKTLRTDLHPLVKFALMTGARKATICGLLWSDVDFATSRIRFRLKGGLTMFFPINAEMRAFLSSLPRADDPAHRRYVLTYIDQQTKRRKRIVTGGGGLDEAWRAALTEAAIPDFRFHDLRHTFATRLLRKTGNLKLVSRLLGHTTVETTTRYAHVLDEDLHDAMAAFSPLGKPESRRKSRSRA
ncbi:site-specific integrase [Pseudorhodobacter sp.]|uniref:tyrosine-type recombinase/integrase n=1 Tax=Pseudorhodobacter sp. TaxID=1934400 RepID=UPI00264A3625|nr:site-specific integrase [Pseudorhodobacter sp.]MDN5786510.1 site-specific integrase [Pseudorhodobacter sp.]